MSEQELWNDMVDSVNPVTGNSGDLKADLDSSVPGGQPFHQDDFSYWTDMAQIGIKTYSPFFEAQDGYDGISSPHPGSDTTSYIGLSAIRQKIAELPVAQQLPEGDAGRATRGNELGLLRLNTAFYPECKDEAYCGIALGVTREDHEKVRPVLDEVFGESDTFNDAVNPPGLDGFKWTRDSLRQSALSFVGSKNHLSIKNDPGVWTAMVLHKTAMDLDLSIDDAQKFVDFQAKAVVITPLPSFVPEWFGGALKVEETLKQKRNYIKIYTHAIEKCIKSGHITNLSIDDEEGIKKTAWGFLDALIFAGGLSVPGVIHAGLAAYYTGLTGTDFDILDPNQAPLLVMESIRHSPPVLGVPYLIGNHRHAPLAGMGGYDKGVYGDDALDFRIRDDLAFYHQNSIDWADTAVTADPGNENPKHSSRICPAKSMSYNMILAFWEAMDPTNWSVDPESDISRENGPIWWSSFEINRKCTGLNKHVGSDEAVRSYSKPLEGDRCNWFSWCDDGFECNRKWWQYSGSCVIDSDYKFLNEGCKVNDNCNHVFTENAKVHLACRFGKCGFADGDVCDEDENIEFADYSELPVIDTNAETGGAWTVSLGVPAIGAAAIFMLRKPERHLKHAKMDENDQVNGRL
ncbi:hypothetical protein TrRE_jg6628 [Triparma retinervis]|uniref:Uncharacterized protein n=1 Tax=Triparma retinervis TaxID=2557542 RepID=A0A9W6Z8A4_9STRA|nr:hypothetical protein TrRE_jg6628 [Triparma retinervis]